MLGCPYLVPECQQGVSYNAPRAARIMQLEVANVLKDHERGLTRSEDVGDFVKQCTASCVPQPGLRSRFREGLARKSGAEDLVLRYRVFAVADVAVNRADAWIVQPIKFTEFGIGFAGKDTLVTETAQSLVKSA